MNQPKQEPNITRCVRRVTADEDWIDFECTFTDGQKGVMIQVSSDFPKLALLIERLINVCLKLKR